jgi:hypothetical protein
MPTRIDLQRYKKTYPFLRREPRNYFLTESDLANVTLETAHVSFAGSDLLVYTFTKSFNSAPTVTATPSGTTANFNVYVSSVDQFTVTLRASAPNNNYVDIHAIEVLS